MTEEKLNKAIEIHEKIKEAKRILKFKKMIQDQLKKQSGKIDANLYFKFVDEPSGYTSFIIPLDECVINLMIQQEELNLKNLKAQFENLH